jgi:DNA gyrase subunit B
VACPPLFKVALGQKTHYATSEAQAAALMAKSARASLQRFKGLGEMMPEELWRTTMDPTRRLLKQISIVDAARADAVFTTLMGENVASRKHFIESRAQHLEQDEIDI